MKHWYTQKNNIPGVLLMIDFQKVFVSLSWSFTEKQIGTSFILVQA